MPVCKSDDFNINYRVYGSGFPLVLTHGFSGNIEVWTPQIAALSQKYKLVLYDTRGHGLSSAPAGAENYTLDIFVEDLHRLLNHIKADKAYVGGLSMGGAISMGYAGKHPERVAGLLIFDIDGGFQPADREVDALMSIMREEEIKFAAERGMADLARRRIGNATAPRPVLNDEALQEWYITRMARFSLNGFAGIQRACPWKANWLPTMADEIKAPTLIIVGGDDQFKRGAIILHHQIKNSRYIEIQGSVHETAVWRPDVFNPAVLEFLASVEAGKPLSGEAILQ